MEQASNSISGARRNEDIALDLLKFVASTTGVGRTTAPSTGFVAATASNGWWGSPLNRPSAQLPPRPRRT
jgi:hypothetical protein